MKSTAFRTIVAFAVIGLTSSVAAADRPVTRTVLAPQQMGVQSLAGGAPIIFYMNKNGGQYRASNYNDSRTNYSTIVQSGISTIAPWNVSASGWSQVMSCMQDMFSRFNVTVTDVDPGASVDHYEIVVAGNPQDVGMDANTGGVSPWTNDCSVIPDSIVFTFAEVYGTDYQGVCETAAQEVAHSFGLDHEYLCQDPMTYLYNCGDKTFQDQAVSCGEYSARTCSCGNPTQNSVQMLYDRVGAATQQTDNPPTVSITSPSNGATVAPGFGVAANASDDNGVARVDFSVDGSLVTSDTSSPYGFQASTSLSDGAHTISAVAYDGAGQHAASQIQVTLHTPGPGEPDAGPGGNPGDPDAGPGGNPGGGDDDQGGGHDGFVTGGCNAGSGGAGAFAILALGGLLAIRRRRK